AVPRARPALSRLHRHDGEARDREHAREALRAPLPAAARRGARAARDRAPHRRAAGAALMIRVLLVAVAAVAAGRLDPYAKAREAARLYAAGKYDDAVTRYNEALTDEPDPALLHLHLGDAALQQGKLPGAPNAV